MNQQENYCLNNKPTSVTADFINTMVGSIVHYKMKEFINQMGPLYKSKYEEEPVNDKNSPHNIYILTRPNATTMVIMEQMFQELLQDKNSKQNNRNNNKYALMAQGHKIFATTANIANTRTKSIN